jgi:small subunit ribosomal protein S20
VKKKKKGKKLLHFPESDGIIYICVECLSTANMRPEEVDGLPNIKSAKKRVLVSEAKTAKNKVAKSNLKTCLKKFDVAVAAGNRAEAESAYATAVKKVDQAVHRGLLHKNTAARRKSSITRKLNRIAG